MEANEEVADNAISVSEFIWKNNPAEQPVEIIR